MRVGHRSTRWEARFLLCLFAATALPFCVGEAYCESRPPALAGPAQTSPAHQLAARPAVGSAPLFVTLSGNHTSGWGEARNSRHRGKFLPDRKAPLMPQKISMVKVVDAKGRVTGSYVLPVFSGDLIVAGLAKQLEEAGYTVHVVRKLPEKSLGLEVSPVATQLEQSPWLLGVKGRCDMRVRLELRQNGRSLASHVYATTRADSSWTGQRLLSGLLTEAAGDITSRAMADVTSGMGNIGAAIALRP